MKKISIILLVLPLIWIVLMGCNNSGFSPATVTVQARLADSGSRVVSSGDVVTTIDHYNVIFKKIEIGNSEEDKFTLWEKPDGETMDITSTVDFSDTLQVYPGSYKYVRIEVDKVLAVEGSIDDNGTIIEGQGTCTLTESTHLFGTTVENWAGEVTLMDEILIVDGTNLIFSFDIDGTVFYLSGTAADAVLDVKKPVISLLVE